MNKKAETTQFVVITATAFLLIGLMVVIFSSKTSITASTTYGSKVCYVVNGEKLSPTDVPFCCSEIKKSTGCEPFKHEKITEELLICYGNSNVVINKETAEFCK